MTEVDETDDPLLQRMDALELAMLTQAAALLKGGMSETAAVDQVLRLRWRLKEVVIKDR